MTDRFYPVGLLAEEDVYKTTYETQNEMRAFQRSAYPPGYSGHEPGARSKFGFSTPGPDAWKLALPELALREEIGVVNPRQSHAVPRMQVSADSETFNAHDTLDVAKSRMGQSTFNLKGTQFMSKSRSLPSLKRLPNPARLTEPAKPLARLEDEQYSYFVPKAMQRERRDKLSTSTLSRLHKESKVTMPFSGEGTGFRTQTTVVTDSPWWPAQMEPYSYSSTNASAFQKPPFYRMSPMGMHAQQ